MRTHSAVFRDGLSMDKRKLSETDIISKFILPAVKTAGWDDITQIRQEVKLRDGKVIVRGQLGVRKTVKSADIACVDNQGQGHAASILFFAKNGMFYALAHEADMNSFEIAMDMRERLSGALKSVF